MFSRYGIYMRQATMNRVHCIEIRICDSSSYLSYEEAKEFAFAVQDELRILEKTEKYRADQA